MKHYLTLLLCIALCLNAQAQQKFNPELKKQLDSIMREDQKYREFFANGLVTTKSDSLVKAFHVEPGQLFNKINTLMIAADTTNLQFIQQVISKYGYPGKSLVGAESSNVAWSVFQHSNQIARYLDLVKAAAKRGEVEKKYAALMEDRVLMYSGKQQIYGTQGRYQKLKTGKSEMIIWPIKDPEKVNKRRKKAGFDTTVEANSKLIGIAYSVITMEELAL